MAGGGGGGACVGKYRMTLTVLPRQKAEKPCSEPTRVKQSTMPASRGGRGERWMERQRGGAEAAVLHAGCRGDALKVKPAGLAGGCSSPGAAAPGQGGRL